MLHDKRKSELNNGVYCMMSVLKETLKSYTRNVKYCSHTPTAVLGLKVMENFVGRTPG